LVKARPIMAADESINEAVRLAATGEFQQRVLRGEQHGLEQRLAKILHELEKAKEANTSAVDWIFGSAEVQAGPATDNSREVIERFRQEKMELDQELLNLSHKLKKLETEYHSATVMIQNCLQPNQADPGKQVEMKKSIIELAKEVDPKRVHFAETLGKIMLRTPLFFLNSNLLGYPSTKGTSEDSRAQPQSQSQGLPALPFDIETTPLGLVFSTVDEFAEKAELQDAVAVTQLLNFLTASSASDSAQEHVMRVVADKVTIMEESDAIAMEKSEFKTAVTALWPNTKDAPNYESYNCIFDQVHKQAAMLFPEATSENPASEEASLVSSWRDSQGQQPEVGSESVRRYKLLMDNNYLLACQKDELVHVTPVIAEALQRMSKDCLEKLKEEELILYGVDGLADQEPRHWFARRKSAARVCNLARTGNLMAYDMICTRMLDNQEHWMVRQLVVCEVCNMLCELTEQHPYFPDLLQIIVNTVFTFPGADRRKTQRISADKELAEQAVGNVQRSAEQSLRKEMGQYRPEIRSRILTALTTVGSNYTTDQARTLLQRLIQTAEQHSRRSGRG